MVKLKLVPSFIRAIFATFTHLFAKHSMDNTFLSTLIFLFKCYLKKLKREAPERKVFVSSPFNLVHQIHSFAIAISVTKTALPSFVKEGGGTILTIDSADQPTRPMRDSSRSTQAHRSTMAGHCTKACRTVSSLCLHLGQTGPVFVIAPCL